MGDVVNLGTSALALAMQSTGKASMKSTGKVIAVDFVEKTVIPKYAAKRGLTTVGVKATLNGGSKLIPGINKIILAYDAVKIIHDIIKWWTTEENPQIEQSTPETPVTLQTIYTLGNIQFMNIPTKLNKFITPPLPLQGATSAKILSKNEYWPIGNRLYIQSPQGDVDVKFDTPPGINLPVFGPSGGASAGYLLYYLRTDGVYEPIKWSNSNSIVSVPRPAGDTGGDYQRYNQTDGKLYFAVNENGIIGTYGPHFRYGEEFPVNGNRIFLSGEYSQGYWAHRELKEYIAAIAGFFKAHPEYEQPGEISTKSDLEFAQRPNYQEFPPEIAPDRVIEIDPKLPPEIKNPTEEELNQHINNSIQQDGFEYAPPWIEADKKPEPGTDPDPSEDRFPLVPPVIDTNPDEYKPEKPGGSVNPIVPAVPIIGGGDSQMVKMYNPLSSELRELARFMLSNDFLDKIAKLFSDPADYVLDLSTMPVKPELGAKETVYLGNVQVLDRFLVPVQMAPVKKQFTTIDCGTLDVPELYHNYLDYNPHTAVSIFIPYVGYQQLDVNEVMGATVGLKYNVDLLTGECMALVTVKRGDLDAVLYQFEGNMAAHIPLTSKTFRDGAIQSAISSITAGAQAGGVGLVAGAAVGAAKLSMAQVNHSGSLSGNAGSLGGQEPFLIITRPQRVTPPEYAVYSGAATSTYANLSRQHGFTVVKDIHLDDVPATAAELDELRELLQGGVILP